MTEQVALWYWQNRTPYVALEATPRSAAVRAFYMLHDDTGAPEGVQFPDGRFVSIWDLPEFAAVRKELDQVATTAEPVELDVREVRVPWDDGEGWKARVPADTPPWVGRPL
jgi:hypothetical protein